MAAPITWITQTVDGYVYRNTMYSPPRSGPGTVTMDSLGRCGHLFYTSHLSPTPRCTFCGILKEHAQWYG